MEQDTGHPQKEEQSRTAPRRKMTARLCGHGGPAWGGGGGAEEETGKETEQTQERPSCHVTERELRKEGVKVKADSAERRKGYMSS